MGCMAKAADREGDKGGTTYGNAGDSNGGESNKEGDNEDPDNASSEIARTVKYVEGSYWEDNSGRPGY